LGKEESEQEVGRRRFREGRGFAVSGRQELDVEFPSTPNRFSYPFFPDSRCDSTITIFDEGAHRTDTIENLVLFRLFFPRHRSLGFVVEPPLERSIRPTPLASPESTVSKQLAQFETCDVSTEIFFEVVDFRPATVTERSTAKFDDEYE
jgi:hypothetical protein